MPDPFLADLLREAPRPPRYRWWVYYAWTLPAGLSFGFGLYALTYGRMPWTGLGFLFGGALICWGFVPAEQTVIPFPQRDGTAPQRGPAS